MVVGERAVTFLSGIATEVRVPVNNVLPMLRKATVAKLNGSHLLTSHAFRRWTC